MKRYVRWMVGSAFIVVSVVSIYFLPDIDRDSIIPSGIWRASKDHGDKPGTGIELTSSGGEISGRFALFESEKPHNFRDGSFFPMEVSKLDRGKFLCSVRLGELQTYRFTIEIPHSVVGDQFVAQLQNVEVGSTPVEHVFVRVK